MPNPLVSILVRSMDRPTLRRALLSAAEQTYPNVEIVVVAASGPVHAELPPLPSGRSVRLVRQAHPLGRSAAANAALHAASGELLNFLDDDDELLPRHLELLWAALYRNPTMSLAYSRTQVVDERGVPAGIFGKKHTRLELFETIPLAIMAALFRRGLLEHGVQFDDELQVGEDHDFWLQCSAHTDFCFVDEVTNRWHAFIGTSGGGGGRNQDQASVERAGARIKAKWAGAKEAFLNTPLGLLQSVRLALLRKENAIALTQAERLVATMPDDINAINLAAMANHYSGNSERAAELIERALAMRPNHEGLLANKRLISGTK